MARALKSLRSKEKRLRDEKKNGISDPASDIIKPQAFSSSLRTPLKPYTCISPQTSSQALLGGLGGTRAAPSPTLSQVNPLNGLSLGVPGQRGLYEGEHGKTSTSKPVTASLTRGSSRPHISVLTKQITLKRKVKELFIIGNVSLSRTHFLIN